MATVKNKILFTYEDLKNWEPDLYRHEIIEGEHFMSPSPNIYHQEIVLNLGTHLSYYVKNKKLGRVFVAPVDVIFSDYDVCVPDLIFVSNENLSIIKEENIQGAPDLLIEVLSPTSEKRDKEIKFKRYAYFGVKDYWIVNPKQQSIEIYDLANSQLVAVVPANQVLNSPLFPDINLELKKIF